MEARHHLNLAAILRRHFSFLLYYPFPDALSTSRAKLKQADVSQIKSHKDACLV